MNIAVFGSGRGSNFQAILAAIKEGRVEGVTISLVLSNNSTSGILEIARANAIPAFHISQKHFSSEGQYADALLALLAAHAVEVIVLAGFMKKIPPRLISAFPGRIINIHPALLPKYGGAGMFGRHVHEAVLAAGEHESGATVHVVDEEYDHGRILIQEKVPVMAGDTPDTLAARVLGAEHRILPEALHRLAASMHKGVQQ
ncbi:MAG: phosphoribosylglycinamide formyltransferase [Bacteroidota bacterium]